MHKTCPTWNQGMMAQLLPRPAVLTMPAQPPQCLPVLTVNPQKPSTLCMLQAPNPHHLGLLGTPLEIQSLTNLQVSVASLP